MADRYWVGGTATWDGTAGTKWALTSGAAGGQAVPTAADDVFFDGASGAVTCTISGTRVAKSITCTGFTGTLAGTATPALTISGSLTLVAGMTLTYAGTTTFDATGTLTSGGKTLGPVTINGSGITVTLGDALTSSGAITVTQGTFTTSASNYAVTATVLSSSNSNTRTISLNGSTVTLSGFAVITFLTSTNLTFNAGTSQINLSGANASMTGGNQTFYDVTWTATNLSLPSIGGANSFRNLTITGRTSAGICLFDIGGNQTITGTLTLSAGTNATMRTCVQSDTIGTTRTLTCAAVASLTDIDFRDITIAGAAVSGGNLTGTRLGDCKGNSGITFTAATTRYWNLAGSNNWSATGWAASSGASPAVNNFPLAQDTAVFESTSPGTGTTTTINANYNIGTIDMSARTSNTMTLATGTTTPQIYGNWINGTGTTITGTSNAITFAGRGSQTITSAGNSFPKNLLFDTPGGSVTLLDALVLTRDDSSVFILSKGTFDANGYNVTLSGTTNARVTSSNTNTRTLAIGSGTWTIASGSSNTVWNTGTTFGLTITGTGTISLTGSTLKVFSGGGAVFTNVTINQGGAGTLSISGSNTFGDITNTYASTGATTIQFASAATTTLGNWTASGTAGKLLTIQVSGGTNHTLSKTSGTVSADYLSISRSTATGGASWYAGANSTNGGNNSGWIFTAPPVVASTGNFLFFFN
jgi:fibronectin-binding autotransporter adhesin